MHYSRSYGPTDKASDFESEDSGFECHQGFETVMGRQTSGGLNRFAWTVMRSDLQTQRGRQTSGQTQMGRQTSVASNGLLGQ